MVLAAVESAVLQDMIPVVSVSAFVAVLFALAFWHAAASLFSLLGEAAVWAARKLGRAHARRLRARGDFDRLRRYQERAVRWNRAL